MASIVRLGKSALRSINHGDMLFLGSGNMARCGQIRSAGHAKWQNIKNVKESNDKSKGQMISRYVLLVRKSILLNDRQADPKLNSKLAAVLNEATRMNVPKATLERAITRATNLKIFSTVLEIEGPGKCTFIARCETEHIGTLKRDVKKLLKKHDSYIMPENSLINSFKSQSFIRVPVKMSDGRDISHEYAEEAAIVVNAHDVTLEIYDESSNESNSRCWCFSTDAESANSCKGELEKLGLEVTSVDIDLVPYRRIKFDDSTTQKILEVEKSLRELDQVLDIFHNAET